MKEVNVSPNDVKILYTRATWGFWNITGIIINHKGNKVLRQSVIWKYWPVKYCKELVKWWEENKDSHTENTREGNDANE